MTTVEAVTAWINEPSTERQHPGRDHLRGHGADRRGRGSRVPDGPRDRAIAGRRCGCDRVRARRDRTVRLRHRVRHPRIDRGTHGEVRGAPKGLYCRDLLTTDLGPFPFWQGDTPDGRAFLWSLVYWSLEGEPDRMDADLNGIPCETLYAPDVIAQVLDGGDVS